MKTIKTLLIAVFVLLCSTMASAHNFEVGGIYYNITNTTAKTVGVTYRGSYSSSYDNEYRGAVLIPETVTYNSKTYSVTSIESYAFYACPSLTSVTIPNSVTSINDYAFYLCTGLKTVYNFSSLTLTAGSSANGYVAYYADNVLNGSLEGDFVFSIIDGVNTLCVYIGNGCDIVLPTDYKGEDYVIGANAFKNEKTVTSVTIPNSVTTIGNSAFYGCTGLTSVTIPNSVTSIESRAFYNCTRLTSVTIGSGVTTIGSSAFQSCTGLTSVTIPNSVTIIGDAAFTSCAGLTSITIPNSVTTIGSSAFRDCTGLTSVTIGSGVTTIGEYAFSNCDIAKTIWLTNTPPSGYSYAAGKINYVANNQYTQLRNVVVYPYLSSLFETDGIKYAPVSPAERTCDAIDCIYDTAIETVNIGKTVLYKNIAMNVKEVMPYTCYKNKNIRNLTISNDGSVGDKAFYGCTGLSDITINNKGNIGTSAFEGSATSGPAKLEISNEGFIGYSAFNGCAGASEITLGNGITSIGESAFYGCSSLEEVVIPNSVTSLNSSAFCNCSALNSVVLSDSIKTIGEYAFSGCRALPEIKIPRAVVSIGDYAFKGCSSLADVIIENRTAALSLGSNGSSPLFADSPLDSVYIGGKISYKTSSSYGYSPFYRNSSLRSVVITDVEEQIYDNEFYGCTGLKNVQIGNGVKSIGKWAFSGCSNLDYLIVGANVSSIGQEAFSDCSNVTTIYAHAMAPPVCEAQALEDINKWNCTLMVPNESIADYQAAEQWKDFFFISNIPTGITEISPDDTEGFDGGAIYDLYGRPVNEPAKGGVYIIDGKKVVL